jgi:hypothetical protein
MVARPHPALLAKRTVLEIKGKAPQVGKAEPVLLKKDTVASLPEQEESAAP